MNAFRDVILVVVAIALVVAVFWPVEDKSREATPAGPQDGVAAVQDSSRPASSKAAPPPSDVAAPAKDVPHPFFPLVAGSEWRYLVSGPASLVPEPDWRMRISRLPKEGIPGIVETGYGTHQEERSVELNDGVLMLDGLPLVAPGRFLGNRPVAMEGVFLPEAHKLIEGAVWQLVYRRELSYRSRDNKENIVDEQVLGTQTDTAQVTAIEKVIVPAGIFENAVRVEWIGRMDMEAPGGRKVLKDMTVEPFKKDTVWFAPGIGMVKRRVTYLSNLKEDVTFDLVSYRRPL